MIHYDIDQYDYVFVPRHGEARRLSVRPRIRPSITKLVSAINSYFMH